MNNNIYNIYNNMRWLKYQLDQNKAFRDWTQKRLLEVRSRNTDNNTVSLCNLILNYIYDVNFREIMTQNKKYNEKGAF